MELALAIFCVLQDEPYFPVKEGTVWTYELSSTGGYGGYSATKSSTLTCACREKKDEAWVFAWAQTDKKKTKDRGKTWVKVGPSKVEIPETDDDKLWLLPANFGEKDQSEVKIKSGKREVTVKSVVSESEEEIEVPAGKFKARKVTSEVKTEGVTAAVTVWYAKGTGAVKIVRKTDVRGAEAEETAVLKKVEGGK